MTPTWTSRYLIENPNARFRLKLVQTSHGMKKAPMMNKCYLLLRVKYEFDMHDCSIDGQMLALKSRIMRGNFYLWRFCMENNLEMMAFALWHHHCLTHFRNRWLTAKNGLVKTKRPAKLTYENHF